MSLVSRYSPASLLWFDPVSDSVAAMAIGGAGVLVLLGVSAWAIVVFVWIVCTAVVSRINPLTTTTKIEPGKDGKISGI